LLTHDDEAMIKSWNAYISNFAKTQSDGSMYACYEPDYIRGGGIPCEKESLIFYDGKGTEPKFVTAHSYPKRKDNSLSRYIWVRAAYTWYVTAAVVIKDRKIIGLNCKLDNDILKFEDRIKQVYLSKEIKNKFITNKYILFL